MAAPQRVTIMKANLGDQPGSVLGIMKNLNSKNIALKSVWGYGKIEGAPGLWAIAKDPDKLRNAWKTSGVFAEEGTGFFMKGPDKTGALLKSLEMLAQAHISMKALVAVAVGGKFGSIICVDAVDVEKAAQVLGAK
jgi:hypothetical protein